jgi:hypothetical protein
VLVHVQFQSLDGRSHQVAILADAAPSNETDPSGGALVAARASLRAGWDAVSRTYANGWHDYPQFIRLAWSAAAGHPVEQPSVVACCYVRKCS